MTVLGNKKAKIDDHSLGNTDGSAMLDFSMEYVEAPSLLGSTTTSKHADREQ